jgi:hypothetical protein
MTREDLINQRATTCRHGGHCEWVACDKCNHYESDGLNQQPCDDCISRQEVINCVTSNEFRYKIVEDIKTLPSVTPKPKIGYISIDDVMSVFDDFMCGEVDEDGTTTFLEMLKDKAESEENKT